MQLFVSSVLFLYLYIYLLFCHVRKRIKMWKSDVHFLYDLALKSLLRQRDTSLALSSLCSSTAGSSPSPGLQLYVFYCLHHDMISGFLIYHHCTRCWPFQTGFLLRVCMRVRVCACKCIWEVLSVPIWKTKTNYQRLEKEEYGKARVKKHKSSRIHCKAPSSYSLFCPSQ